jgi:hypothetical protein
MTRLSPVALSKKVCEDDILPVTGNCKIPCTSGCRGGRGTFTGQEYMLLFKGERLSKKMENILKSNYAISNAVVK